MNIHEPWIQTFLGNRFHPLNPLIDEVDIRDIAHALSMKCRFTGHSREFYSVAQHSCHCADYVENRNDADFALMHDAGEAYLPDVASPIKAFIPGFSLMEERVLKVILFRFGIYDVAMPEAVHRIDRRMLVTERRDLFPVELDCPGFEGVIPLPRLSIESWSPEKAEAEFLTRFARLFPSYAKESGL